MHPESRNREEARPHTTQSDVIVWNRRKGIFLDKKQSILYLSGKIPYGVVVNIAVFHTAATSSILVMGEINFLFLNFFFGTLLQRPKSLGQ